MNARRPENERALRGAPFANLMHILVGFARLEGILSRETDEDLSWKEGAGICARAERA